MRAPIAIASTLCLAAVLLTGGSKPSHADFRVCNSSSALTAVAIGYSDARGWVSRGWFAVPAGGCQTVISGDLGRGIYYVFGQDDQGSSFAAPPAQVGGYFCTQPGKFELRNNDYLNASNALDCTSHGLKVMKFRQVDVNDANYTFNLSAAPQQAASQPTSNVNVNTLVNSLITTARTNPQGTTPQLPVIPVSAQPAPSAPTAPVANSSASSPSAAPLACQRYPNLC